MYRRGFSAFEDPRTAQRLKESVERPPTIPAARDHGDTLRQPQRTAFGSQYMVVTPGGGIPKKEGSVLGKANCTLQWVNDADNSTAKISPQGAARTLTVWNNSLEDIPGDTVVIANDIYGKPVIDAPVAAQPPDVKPRPWMKFTTTGSMTDEQINATIDLVEPGDLINPGTSLPWAPGDSVVVTDPHNQWALAEANATGTAYYRTAGNRWEIQTCSLPAEYVNGVLYLDGGESNFLVPPPGAPTLIEVDISGTVDKPWSYPGVDPPPELAADLISPCTNPFGFSAKAGSEVTIRRVSKDQAFADASNLALGPGQSSTQEEWQIVRVKEPVARWGYVSSIKDDVLTGKALDETWDGIDPNVPVTIRLLPGFSIPCDTPMICSFDPESSSFDTLQYVATSAPTAMLPFPSTDLIHVGDLTATGCSIGYDKRNAYVWNPPGGSLLCDKQVTNDSVSLQTVSVDVVDSISYDATGLTWTYTSVLVCGTGVGPAPGTLPFSNCPPPDDPCGYTRYTWNGVDTWDKVVNCANGCSEDTQNAPIDPPGPDDPWVVDVVCTGTPT